MKMWDCVAVACPSCDAAVGVRCQPLKPPYKVRSKRLEVDAPHAQRSRVYGWELRRMQKLNAGGSDEARSSTHG